jgi:hypothetical protein
MCLAKNPLASPRVLSATQKIIRCLIVSIGPYLHEACAICHASFCYAFVTPHHMLLLLGATQIPTRYLPTYLMSFASDLGSNSLG